MESKISNISIEALLLQLGLRCDRWVDLEVIDKQTDWILDNMNLFDTLPKKVQGDLKNLKSNNVLKRRKTIVSLCRRLARYIEAAVLAKRKQVYINKKTESRYSYRLIKS
tara:strand:- start:132 stop:461 length:330 start_codon:yes stop_codon:yes gene_type:complete